LAPKRVVVNYIVLPLVLKDINSCQNDSVPGIIRDVAKCLVQYSVRGFLGHIICSARNVDGTIAFSAASIVLRPLATNTLLPMLVTGISTHETTIIEYLWHPCEHRWSVSTMRQASESSSCTPSASLSQSKIAAPRLTKYM
jgi:hypothetical protein